MYGGMIDIQSATAEIRRGKRKNRKTKKQDKNIMSASAIRRAAIKRTAWRPLAHHCWWVMTLSARVTVSNGSFIPWVTRVTGQFTVTWPM